MKDQTLLKLSGVISGTMILLTGAVLGVDSTLTLVGGLALGSGLGIPIGAYLKKD